MYDFRDQGLLDAWAYYDAMNPAEGSADNLCTECKFKETEQTEGTERDITVTNSFFSVRWEKQSAIRRESRN